MEYIRESGNFSNFPNDFSLIVRDSPIFDSKKFIGYFLIIPSNIKFSLIHSDMALFVSELNILKENIQNNKKFPKELKEIIIVPNSNLILIYDLLNSLLNGTILSVVISVLISTLVIILITQRLCTSLTAICSIILIIITTISMILWLSNFLKLDILVKNQSN